MITGDFFSIDGKQAKAESIAINTNSIYKAMVIVESEYGYKPSLIGCNSNKAVMNKGNARLIINKEGF